MTTWMVTGGAGYIGAHVARRLVESGRDVVVLDDLSTRVPVVRRPEATFVEASSPISPADLAGVDGVVHLAALKYAGVSVEEPLRFYRNNVDGMRACSTPWSGRVQPSRTRRRPVYGTPRDEHVVESTPIGPRAPTGDELIGG